MRPYTQDYKSEILDNFDLLIIEWLKSLNLNNLSLIHSKDILFDHQLSQLSKIYDGVAPTAYYI